MRDMRGETCISARHAFEDSAICLLQQGGGRSGITTAVQSCCHMLPSPPGARTCRSGRTEPTSLLTAGDWRCTRFLEVVEFFEERGLLTFFGRDTVTVTALSSAAAMSTVFELARPAQTGAGVRRRRACSPGSQLLLSEACPARMKTAAAHPTAAPRPSSHLSPLHQWDAAVDSLSSCSCCSNGLHQTAPCLTPTCCDIS